MTDLEREAGEIVRAVLDACARAEGYTDYHDAVDWSVDQLPFRQRIVALARQHADEQVRISHEPQRNYCGGQAFYPVHPRPEAAPRTFSPL